MRSAVARIQDSKAPLIPIVLGVVGHRDIHEDDKADLRKALQDVFDQFDAAYPHSPKVLLSPLAPGADQLAADVALFKVGELDEDGKPKKRPNWSVRAPLAFPPNLFLKSTSFTLKHLITESNPTGVDVAAQMRFTEFMADDRVDWFVVPLPDEFVVPPRGESVTKGRTVQKKNGEWFISSVLGGEPDEKVNWEATVAIDRELSPAQGDFRSASYANTGGYIVRHCHTLIALWDKEGPKRFSGTAEIVKMQLGGIAPKFYPWTASVPLGFDGDRGPVIWIHTPRATAEEREKVGERHVLVPSLADEMYFGEKVKIAELAKAATPKSRWNKRLRQAWGEREEQPPKPGNDVPRPGPWEPNPLRDSCAEYNQFLAICQTIDLFNEDSLRLHAAGGESYTKRLTGAEAAARAIFPESDSFERDRYKTSPFDSLHRLVRVREMAAALSNQLAPQHDGAVKQLFWVLAGILIVFHIYVHPPWHWNHSEPIEYWWWLLLVYLAGWGILINLVMRDWSRLLDDRRHDYRAMAEALRVRQVFAVAGLGRSVADTYMGQLRSELTWVRRALQHLSPPPHFWLSQFQMVVLERKLARLRWVEKNWVIEQQTYHGGEPEQDEKKDPWLVRLKKWLIQLAFRKTIGKEEKTVKPSRIGKRTKEEKNALWYRRWGFVLAITGVLLLGFLPLCGAAIVELAKYLQIADVHESPPQESVGTATPATGDTAVENLPPRPRRWFVGFLENWLHPSRPVSALLLVGSALLIIGGLFVAVCERLAYDQLAKQSDQMFVVFRSGARELKDVLDRQPLDVTRAQRIVEELGREAVQDSAHWLLIRRSKPLELPLGG